jgi:hypothetical protein
MECGRGELAQKKHSELLSLRLFARMPRLAQIQGCDTAYLSRQMPNSSW